MRFCNNANSDKSVFLPIHSKREKKVYSAPKCFILLTVSGGLL